MINFLDKEGLSTLCTQIKSWVEEYHTTNIPTIENISGLSDQLGSLQSKEPIAGELLIVNGKINEKYIPDSILGQVEYKGIYDASVGDTTIVPQKGWYYIAKVAGHKNPDGTTSTWDYQVGDWAIYDDVDGWGKIDNTDSVRMVNNQIGNVETYKKDFNAQSVYFVGDIVKHNNKLWLCVSRTDPTKSTNPPSEDNENFLPLSPDYKSGVGILINNESRTIGMKFASDGEVGGFQTGFVENETARNYAVKLSAGKAYVNIPWIKYESDRGISLVDGKFGHSNPVVTQTTATGGTFEASNGGNISFYQYSYDQYGHITGKTSKTYTLPTYSGIDGAEIKTIFHNVFGVSYN